MKKFGKFLLCFVPMIAFLEINTLVSSIALIYYILVDPDFWSNITSTASINFAENYKNVSNSMLAALDDTNFLIAATIAYQVLAIILGVIFYRFVFKQKKLENPGKCLGWRCPVYIVAFSIAIEALIGCLLCYSSVVFPRVIENYSKMMEQYGFVELTLASAIATIFLAPVCEEMIFRGMTLKLAGKFTDKFWIANLIQALAFGVAHLNLVQGTYAFILALFLGFIYRKFDSLWATILVHMTFNFTGTYLVTPIFGPEGEGQDATIRVIIITVLAIIIVTGMLILICKDKKTKEREPMFFERVMIGCTKKEKVANVQNI